MVSFVTPASGGGTRGDGGKDDTGGKLQQAAAPVAQGYFTARLAALFVFLTAMLVFLPLVLPPLPPPSPMLLVVPVGLMAAIMLALALMPSEWSDARLASVAAAAVASSCLY